MPCGPAVLVLYRSHRHPRGWRPVSCQRRLVRRRTHGFGRAAHRANVRAIGVGPHASSRRRSRAVAAVIIGRGEAAPLLPSLCTTSHAYLNVKYRAHLRRRPDATERAPPLPRQRPQRGGRSWWTRAARALHGLQPNLSRQSRAAPMTLTRTKDHLLRDHCWRARDPSV